MDRIKSIFRPQQGYEPVENNVPDDDGDSHTETEVNDVESGSPFSWVEYAIFVLQGVAMLWAWNMFLAAAPYFQTRFASNSWILSHFQSAEISISSVTNVGTMLILTKLQKNASYPKRISTALICYTVLFTILALSTLVKTSASVYFWFLLIVVALTSASTGLVQNGLFSFASGFGRSEYTQGIMTGQGIAGVLPPLAQIITVMAVPSKKTGEPKPESQSPKSAFIYFLTATAVSGLAFLAFVYLARRHNVSRARAALKSAAETTANGTSERDDPTDDALASQIDHDRLVETERASVPMTTLFKKLPFLAAAVFICFAVTMVFPVFTTAILSVSGIDSAVFIPLGFLVWNIGDLVGRLITLSPSVSLTHYPFALFCIAMARFLFIPLYFLCNIHGRGAAVNSDVFYLLIVQGLFGVSNGYLGSECMMGAGDWVAPEEREAAGGFMGLMLVSEQRTISDDHSATAVYQTRHLRGERGAKLSTERGKDASTDLPSLFGTERQATPELSTSNRRPFVPDRHQALFAGRRASFVQSP